MLMIPNLSIVPLEEYLIIPKQYDIFFCCSSFEERCTRSSEILKVKNTKIGTTILHNYKERDPRNNRGKYAKRIENLLRPISNEFLANSGESFSSPKEGVAQFFSFLEEYNIDLYGKKIAVDITVFTKSFFFLLFKTLREKYSLRKFSIIYTEPERYKTGTKPSGEVILTEGLDRLESIPGYSGSSINSKDALIVQLGFEGKRALDVFYNINPEISYAINGFPSYKPEWHKISLESNMRFLMESKAYCHLFSAPALDPFETEKVIDLLNREIKTQGFNVVISPLGTKLQAFGAMLYALKDKETKVVYPFPSFFPADYSHKFGPSWILEAILPSQPKK